ncbi:MAG: hypothetical protein QME42_01785 [bacterium]|nr:hypothetical protein [bacterium]
MQDIFYKKFDKNTLLGYNTHQDGEKEEKTAKAKINITVEETHIEFYKAIDGGNYAKDFYTP